MSATSPRAWATVAAGASRAIIWVIRWVRPVTIVAEMWCSLFTMFISASDRCGKAGAACSTPTTGTALPPMRSDLPTIAGSPPNRFCQ
jgi:hypothetical protein